MATICAAGVSAHTSAGGSANGRAYIEYSISDQADRVVITSTMMLSIEIGTRARNATNRLVGPSSTTWTVYTTTYSANSSNAVGASTSTPEKSAAVSATQTTTIYKTHSAQTVNITAYYYRTEVEVIDTLGKQGGANLTSRSVTEALPTISARTSYAVTFDANSGSGAPAQQTKWHGETLTIPTTTPVKSGYTFIGWATSLENASAGTVAYAAGASYTDNAPIALYAVWELTYSKPTIQNVSIERCLQNGTLDDEGDYALVTFDWSIFKSSLARYYGGSTAPYSNNSVSNCTATVGTRTATKSLTGASGTASMVVGNGTFDSETAYNASISITDSQTVISDHTTTAVGTLPTPFFPMDFNADATAVAFFMPAPNSGVGAYFGRDVNVYVDSNVTSGTDGQINQALTNLGWTDVLS